MKTKTDMSTNGRWGIQLAMPDEFDSKKSIWRAEIKSLGKSAGYDCFELFETTEEKFVVLTGEVKLGPGCSGIVENLGLQSNSYTSLFVAIPGALWQSFGYKGRSSSWNLLLEDGTVICPEPAILLAAGLIVPKEDSTKEIKAPDPLPGALAMALKKAGLVK